MNRLALAAFALLLSGCFGYPPGTAGPGSTVVLYLEIADENGSPIGTRQAMTIGPLGSGAGGLGVGFEHALLGLGANDTLEYDASSDPAFTMSGRQSRSTLLQETTLQLRRFARSDFENQYGPAEIGKEFSLAGTQFPYVVRELSETEVAALLQVPADFTDEHPDYGVRVRLTQTGTYVAATLEPLVGTVFVLQNNPDGTNALNLPPGTYRSLESHGDTLEFAYSPVMHKDLVGRHVVLKAQILAVQEAPRTLGDVGPPVRNSPAVLGDPRSAFTPGPVASDGHDHAH